MTAVKKVLGIPLPEVAERRGGALVVRAQDLVEIAANLPGRLDEGGNVQVRATRRRGEVGGRMPIWISRAIRRSRAIASLIASAYALAFSRECTRALTSSISNGFVT